MAANTFTLETDFNVSPYWDDFDESKNYHRMLFRPGVAVQTRELNQLQTILQNQIDRFGENIFTEGSIVSGISLNVEPVNYVKIRDTHASSADTVDVTNFNDTQVVGQTSGVTAIVVDTEEGSVASSPNLKTLYVKYVNTGNAGNSNDGRTTFSLNERLNANNTLDATVFSTSDAIGLGTRLTVSEGIIFAKDHFIRVPEQSIIVGRYDADQQYKIGFNVVETIIDSTQDSSLFDNAAGSFNVNAPGANRLKLTPTLVRYRAADTVDSSFIEIAQIDDGEILTAEDKPNYSVIGEYIANRHYDTAGNFITNGLAIRLREHLKEENNQGRYESGDNEKLVVEIDPGIAYVKGYRVENIAALPLEMDKANEIETVVGEVKSPGYRNFVIAKKVSGAWDTEIINHSRINLHDTSTNFSNDNIIGLARIRYIEHNKETKGTDDAEYRLYLYDINMTSGDFSKVRGISFNDTTNEVRAVITEENAKLNDTTSNRSLFATGTNSASGVNNVSFEYVAVIELPITDGTGTINPPDGDEFPQERVTDMANDDKDEEFTVISSSDGQFHNLNDVTVDTSVANKISFNFGNAASDGTYNVICRVRKIRASHSDKTNVKNIYVKIDVGTNLTGPWNLGFSDIHEIVEVRKDTSAFDSATQGDVVTDDFVLDTGQTDNLYTHGKLRLRSGASVSSGDHLLVKLNYFRHTRNGYFSIGSYEGINVEKIPIYVSPVTGISYDLRNHIDFRPRIEDTADGDATAVVDASVNPIESTTIAASNLYMTPDSQFSFDLDYYLPRKDIITVGTNGTFTITNGEAINENPEYPDIPTDHLLLARIDVAPFPSLSTHAAQQVNRFDLACKISTVRNERYTMRDIGILRDRIDRLEYSTRLNQLELQALNLKILNSDGEDRFKNGIIVDSFSGHNIANPSDQDYRASIDKGKGELRPSFSMTNVELDFDSVASVGYQGHMTGTGIFDTGDLKTVDFDTQDVVIEQPYATTSRNAAGLYWNFLGNITLNPPQDFWTDTVTTPDLVINFDNTNDNILASRRSWTSDWSNWENSWFGTERTSEESRRTRFGRRRQQLITESVTRQNVGQSRFRTQFTRVPTTTTESLGNRIIDTSIIPFMRPRQISVSGVGFKPSTRLYAFFDGIDVNEHMRPSGGSFGDNLVTNGNGEITATFRIPRGEFRVGDRRLRLTDSPTNESTAGLVTTSGEATYSARGQTNTLQEAIVSTRTTEVVQETIRQSRTITTENRRVQSRVIIGGNDPIAQTFEIPNRSNTTGVYLTKVDLYFATKDSNRKVFIDIREVDPSTSLVTNKIVPLSRKTVNPGDINTSDNGSAQTQISFDAPIFLLTGKEYAITIKPEASNPNVSLFVARLGGTDLVSGERISSQPNVGILFASSNDRVWTPIHEEDLKFRVHIARFETGSENVATIALKPQNKDYFVLEQISDETKFNDIGEQVTAGSARGTIDYFDSVNHDKVHLYINKTTTANFSAGDTISGPDGATAVITEIINPEIDTLRLNTGLLHFENNKISAKLQLKGGTTTNVNINNDTRFTEPKYLLSASNSNTANTTADFIENIQFSLETSNHYIAPSIDTERTSLLLINNIINNDSTGENSTHGGNAQAKYISRKLELPDDQDAEDIRVRLLAYRPPKTDIKVYYKILNAADNGNFEDRSWVEMDRAANTSDISSAENEEDFIAIDYEVPEAQFSTSAPATIQYTAGGVDYVGFKHMAIKIVMLAETGGIVPKVTEMMAIALQS